MVRAAPTCVEYEPAKQFKQVELPAAEYLPAAQSEQLPTAVAPSAAENLPAAQLVQTEAPAAAEYLPAAQSVQTVEVVPAAYLPAPQSEQVSTAVAPSAAENLPAAQLVQTEAPANEYVPAVQSSLLASTNSTGLIVPNGQFSQPNI